LAEKNSTGYPLKGNLVLSDVERLRGDQLFKQIRSEAEKWLNAIKDDYRQRLETQLFDFRQGRIGFLDIFDFVTDAVIIQKFLCEIALHAIWFRIYYDILFRHDDSLH